MDTPMITFLRYSALFLLAAPLSVSAGQILTIPDPAARVDTEFNVYVEVLPASDSINVVEGSVAIPQGMHVVNISTAGSAFPLWAATPIYEVGARRVRFTGGAPRAVSGDEAERLFTMTIRADAAGTYSFQPDAAGFADDGQGTRVKLESRTENVQVGGESVLREGMKASTSKLTAEIGSDPSVYDGAWFVTAYGGDKGGGVAYYEVQEGDSKPERFSNAYILKDQTRESRVTVSAIAPDGSRTSIVVGESGYLRTGVMIVIAILLLLGGVYFFRRRL